MADITYFYQLDENNQPVLDADNQPVIRQREQTATLDELKQMIADKRPQKAIDGYKQFVANGENWAKFDEWQSRQDDYLAECELVRLYNENPDLDEDGNELLRAEPNPPEPLSFTVRDVSYVDGLLGGIEFEQARLSAYGEVGNQLDMLFRDIKNGTLDATGEFFLHISQVKTDIPKPE